LWWGYPGYRRIPPITQPLSPEQELDWLESYKRGLEDEINRIKEEIKRVEEEIERLKKEIESMPPEFQQPSPTYPPAYQPAPMPGYGMEYQPMYMPGPGYGMGWGRRMGWGRGMGRGWGAMPPAAAPQMPQLPPLRSGVKRVVVAVEDNNGLDSRISSRFGRAPFMAFVDVADGEVKAVNIIPNQAANLPTGAGISVAQWVISAQATDVIAPYLGPNVSMVFSQAGLRVHSTEPLIPLSEALRRAGFIR